MINTLMMLVLYGMFFAIVIVTFLRWGGVNDAAEGDAEPCAQDVLRSPQNEGVPLLLVDAGTSRDEEDVYATAN